MKKFDSYRPSSFVAKRVPRRRKKSLKPFFSLLFILFFLVAAFVGLSKGYAAYSSAKISRWAPQKAVVSGLDGNMQKELLALGSAAVGKPFTPAQAAQLRTQIVQKYPMLREVDVSRGLLSGTLKISAERRTPVAKFVLPDNSVRYIDSDSTVYADPNPGLLTPVPFVELEGRVPEKLTDEFVGLVQSTLKLEKELSFAFLRFNLERDEVAMHMPDGTVIDFGPAKNLRAKARRAAQIIGWCRRNEKGPQRMDFRFFENGQVFLTQLGK